MQMHLRLKFPSPQILGNAFKTHTHTHTHTHVGFYGLRGLSIGVMVFILYKLYVLLPYTYPTPKLSPHRRRCISIFPQKNVGKKISVLNYGDTENVLINHLLLVIPMSYPCHYTNLCPHKPHKHAHTHTHTHTHTITRDDSTFNRFDPLQNILGSCFFSLCFMVKSAIQIVTYVNFL